MPVLVQVPDDAVSSECNFADPDQMLLIEKDNIGVQPINDDITRFQDFIAYSLPDEKEHMIYFCNFRISDVQALITANPDCGFLRVYNARKEDGTNYVVMTPVLKPSGLTKAKPDTRYLAACCACKPNCGKGGFQ